MEQSRLGSSIHFMTYHSCLSKILFDMIFYLRSRVLVFLELKYSVRTIFLWLLAEHTWGPDQGNLRLYFWDEKRRKLTKDDIFFKWQKVSFLRIFFCARHWWKDLKSSEPLFAYAEKWISLRLHLPFNVRYETLLASHKMKISKNNYLDGEFCAYWFCHHVMASRRSSSSRLTGE